MGWTERNAPCLAILALAVVALGGCPTAPDSDPRPLVVVSVEPQRYAVDRIAGDRVRVAVLIPPGASPVTHEPGVAQLKALEQAALFVKVGHPGFPFEAAWLDALLAGAPELPVVDGSAGVASRSGDPHVWLAPRQMEQLAIALEAALERILPDQRAALAANLACR